MQGTDEREEKRKSLRKKVGICSLTEVFAAQEVPSSALTGFSAATGSLAVSKMFFSCYFLFFFSRACIDVIPTMPGCPTESPKFKTVGPHI